MDIEEPPSIRIRADELRTVREAMRDFGSLLAELEQGEVEKLVLTRWRSFHGDVFREVLQQVAHD